MKKLVSMLLALVMVISVGVTVNAAGTGVEGPPTPVTERPPFDPPTPWGAITHIVTTQPNADLWHGFSNIGTNMDVKNLLHWGAGTMYTGPTGMPYINPMVVREFTDTVNEDGTRTFSFVIYEDWLFSDGTPITAEHYVFYLLLRNHVYFGLIDGQNTWSLRLQGWAAYSSGETHIFEGVRLYDEFSFSMTVSAEYIPAFWAFSWASAEPLPIHVIAPGTVVVDEGNGAFLAGTFSLELIQETINTPGTGHRFFPSVVAGPYYLVVSRPSDGFFVVRRNMYFRGTWDGVFPLIEEITVHRVPDALYVSAVQANMGQIVTGVTGMDHIEAFLDMADDGIFEVNDFERPGFAFLRFHEDIGATQYRSVRQAVAWIMDRDELNRIFLGGLGVVPNSLYATAFSVFQNNREWLEDNLTVYSLNPERAIEVLEADGWVLNSQGDPFNPATDFPRYRWSVCEFTGDEILRPLEINWMSSIGSLTDAIALVLLPEAEPIGLRFNHTITEFAELQRNAQRQGGMTREEAVYSMFNFATTWTAAQVAYWNMFDPALTPPGGNNNWMTDDRLWEIGMQMFVAETAEEYDAAWLEMLVALNYEMLDIPLYSNIWFNFIRSDINLRNYNGDSFWGFPNAIQRAWLCNDECVVCGGDGC